VTGGADHAVQGLAFRCSWLDVVEVIPSSLVGDGTVVLLG
jgi:hypothetical protein